jgi:YggT family protein
MNAIVQILDLLLTLLIFAIFARAILSWVMPVGRDGFTRVLVDITEPILAPIRSMTQRLFNIPIDFSPFIATILIWMLQGLLHSAVRY